MVDIVFRPTCPSDYRPLAEMIDREWDFHLYSEKKGLDMAEYYLLHCMHGSNEALTLLVDGDVAGVLVIREAGDDTLDFSSDLARALDSIKDDPQFDRCEGDLEAIYGQYERFALDYKRPEWAELRLVILSEATKGMGLGRRMIDEAGRIASARGKTGLFFFTDTDCNYGFYDHIGAVRVDEGCVMCMGVPLRMFAYRLDV
jgi:hypothetical protein